MTAYSLPHSDGLCTILTGVLPLPTCERSESDPPTLDRSQHSADLCDFVAEALAQEPSARPTATALTEHASFHERDETADTAELRAWVHTCLDHDNAGAAVGEPLTA